MKLLQAFVGLALAVALPANSVAAEPKANAAKTQAGFQPLAMPNGTEIGVVHPASEQPTVQRLGLYAQVVVAGGSSSSGRQPPIVISQGTGGDFASHVDTAVALARAGFIVAALTQLGDSWRDHSRATDIEARPVALSNLISYI